MLLQLNPTLPVYAKKHGYGDAFIVADYVVALAKGDVLRTKDHRITPLGFNFLAAEQMTEFFNCKIKHMSLRISLEEWIRDKVNCLESVHEYSVATDSIRCWIDEYNDLKNKKMEKQTFTRQEVVELMEELLQRGDFLVDAVQNEYTEWDAEKLISFAEKCMYDTITYCEDPVGHSLYTHNPETGETTCLKCQKPIKVVDSSTAVSVGKKLKEDEAE